MLQILTVHRLRTDRYGELISTTDPFRKILWMEGTSTPYSAALRYSFLGARAASSRLKTKDDMQSVSESPGMDRWPLDSSERLSIPGTRDIRRFKQVALTVFLFSFFSLFFVEHYIDISIAIYYTNFTRANDVGRIEQGWRKLAISTDLCSFFASSSCAFFLFYRVPCPGYQNAGTRALFLIHPERLAACQTRYCGRDRVAVWGSQNLAEMQPNVQRHGAHA